MISSIAGTFLAGVMALGSIFGLGAAPQTFGDFNPTGGGTYRLASSIGTTDTTIRLSSFKEPVSNIPYTMSYINTDIAYGTLDPQTTKSEFIAFTGITQNSNGTALLTGVTRGLARTPGASDCTTASSTLKQSHAGQSIFILSDSPCFFSEYAVKDNNETITGQWTFDVFPITPDSPAASETTAGIVELATAAQAQAGTSLGETGFRLVLPNSLSTSTWTADTAAGNVPILGSGGKLDGNFIDALATTTTIGDFPAYQIGMQQQIFTSTGTSSFTVPEGITKVEVWTCGGGAGGGTGAASGAGGGGGGGGCAFEIVDVTGTTSIQVYVGAGVAAGTTGQWSTFGTNGFYNSATGGTLGTANGNGGVGGVGSGGDLNIQGGPGCGGRVDDATALPNSSCGGSSHFGGGGSAGSKNGGNYGGGGSGGQNGAGGTGAQGLVWVQW